jgi:exocyst complex component 1
VVHFIKHFPVYVGRVESQLIGADTLGIRQSVDGAYDRIVQSMFGSLKHMAKMNGEDEDKGQLNYHVILIGKLEFSSHCQHIDESRCHREHALLCG